MEHTFKPNKIVLETPVKLKDTSEIQVDQKIYFGSPGTGKSHKVNDLLDMSPEVIKAKFEKYLKDTVSESSASQYKGTNGILNPIIATKFREIYGGVLSNIYSITDLEVIDKLYDAVNEEDKTAVSSNGTANPFHNCYCSIKQYKDFIITLPHVSRITFHPESDYSSFVGCYKPEMDGSTISYKFIPQAFTDAYTHAWKNRNQHTYLVIEEINRGNCAAIFGDLFQLLDRKEGFSEYPVKAEHDLARYLRKELIGDSAEGIKDGNLRLPDNFHIIATMNTSDQGLFPMDSAFKRRWDWEYVPVKKGDKEYTLKISGVTNDSWWEFLKAINCLIEKVTLSSDKKLGFWFVKPQNNTIDVKLFVNKVISYLWNDVFKNIDKKNKSNAFRFKTSSDVDFHSYDSFYDRETGAIDEQMVAFFINGIHERFEAPHSIVEEQENKANN